MFGFILFTAIGAFAIGMLWLWFIGMPVETMIKACLTADMSRIRPTWYRRLAFSTLQLRVLEEVGHFVIQGQCFGCSGWITVHYRERTHQFNTKAVAAEYVDVLFAEVERWLKECTIGKVHAVYKRDTK